MRLLDPARRLEDGVFATGVLHLWHREADRSALAENERKLTDVVVGHTVVAQSGLSTIKGASRGAASAG